MIAAPHCGVGSIVPNHEKTVGERKRFFFEKKNQKTFVR
jgi:hypothetical protein